MTLPNLKKRNAKLEAPSSEGIRFYVICVSPSA